MASTGNTVPSVDDFRSTRYPGATSPTASSIVTRLLWSGKQSGKTFTSRGDKGRGKKKPKQLVTMLPCANMMGTENGTRRLG